jgi:uncharacterized protein YjbJ (UPF0337 family)
MAITDTVSKVTGKVKDVAGRVTDGVKQAGSKIKGAINR